MNIDEFNSLIKQLKGDNVLRIKDISDRYPDNSMFDDHINSWY